MRIVGGSLKGRRLQTPGSKDIRPTSDRTRESLFNILAARQTWHGARVIDLFAGTGALGFEAASRGAAFVLLVENSAQGRALIRANMESLELTGASKLFRRDATNLGTVGNMEPFDIAFADPPYALGLGERAARALQAGGWLKSGALLVLEEAGAYAPAAIEGYFLEDRRDYGDTALCFFRSGQRPEIRDEFRYAK
jgi:16S rRNA (guanine966-N2)-methyltransferase